MGRGRPKNKIPTEPLKLSTTPQVWDDLRQFVATGYFGKTPSEAAELILRERLRVMLKEERELLGRRKAPKLTK